MNIKRFLSYLKSSLIIRNFIIIIALFLTFTMIATSLWSAGISNTSYDTSSSYIYDIISSSNEHFESQLENISSYEQIIYDLSKSHLLSEPTFEDSRLKEAMTNCYNSLSSYVYGIGLIDLNGNLYEVGFPQIENDFFESQHFLDTINNRDSITITAKSLGNSPDDQYVSLSRTILYSNEPIAVLIFDIRPNLFIKSFGMSRMRGNLRTIIADDEKNVVYQSSSIISAEVISKIIDFAFQNKYESQTLHELAIDNEHYLIMSQKSTYTGWTSITFFKKNILTERYQPHIVTVALYSAAIFLAILAVCVLLFCSFFKKINKFVGQIATIDIEDITNQSNIIEYNSNDEIGIIASKVSEMLQKIFIQINQINSLNEEKHRRELIALKVQLNSHFLYNSLNIITNLSKSQGCSNIQTVSESLVHLLRYSTDPKPGYVTLSDEISYIRNYLMLMKHNFLHDVEVHYDIDEAILDCYTIKMLLQPVIENSIKYAFDDKDGQYIIIKAHRFGDDVELRIIDNGKGIPKNVLNKILQPDYTQQGHLGLSNLDKRIKLSFGEKYGISIHSIPGMQTAVIIKIPYVIH